MSKPRFSIIVPVYNVENYLSECLDSILKQNYSNFELILIDDGSKDRSGRICDDYAIKDSRVKVIHQNNAGLSAARNRGLEEIKGDYVLFIDSDDLIRNDTLQLIQAHSIGEPDLIIFGFEYFYPDGGKRYSESMSLNDKAKDYLKEVAINKVFNQCVAWNKAYRSELFHSHSSYRFINGVLHEDGPFFHATIAASNKIAIINEHLYKYRKGREDAITSSCSYKNFSSLSTGINWVLENAIIKDKNYYKYQKYILLHTLIFIIIQDYNNKDDLKKIVKASSSIKTKKLLFNLLFSKFCSKFSLLALLSIISPSLSRKMVRVGK